MSQTPPEPAIGLDGLLAALGRFYLVVGADLQVRAASEELGELVGVAPGAEGSTPLSHFLEGDVGGPEGVVAEVLATGRRREGIRAFVRRGDEEALAVSMTAGRLPDGTAVVMLRPEAPEEDAAVPEYEGIVGRSASMQRIFRLFELLRDHDSTVLITGESGTGKELVARAVHRTSHRSAGAFVAVNCAALPSELLESELFGHVRGAFTGAVRDRVGRFELADGGTLFLDEIGAMSLPLQAKILRALQQQTFERVGDTRTREVDVRIIAATNENLTRAVQEHRFREDLYYRLRVVPIEIPPLRDRRDDIEAITRHLLHRIGGARGRSLRLSPSALDALTRYEWPGNVRELENALEFATTVCQGQTIHLQHLPVEVRTAGMAEGGPHGLRTADLSRAASGEADAAAGPPRPYAAPAPVPLPAGLTPSEAAEARDILDALTRARYNRQHAAGLLGMSRTTLWRKMKLYRL